MNELPVFLIVVFTLLPFALLTIGLVQNYRYIKRKRKEWAGLGDKPTYRNVFSTELEYGAHAGGTAIEWFYDLLSVYAFLGLCLLIAHLIVK